MFRTAMVAAAFGFAFSHAALAEDAMMKCDDASMMKMQSDMDANSTATMENKEKAKTEMMMAKDSMTAGKMDDCAMHMKGAMEAMKKT